MAMYKFGQWWHWTKYDLRNADLNRYVGHITTVGFYDENRTFFYAWERERPHETYSYDCACLGGRREYEARGHFDTSDGQHYVIFTARITAQQAEALIRRLS